MRGRETTQKQKSVLQPSPSPETTTTKKHTLFLFPICTLALLFTKATHYCCCGVLLLFSFVKDLSGVLHAFPPMQLDAFEFMLVSD